jgi:hypothetical protein
MPNVSQPASSSTAASATTPRSKPLTARRFACPMPPIRHGAAAPRNPAAGDTSSRRAASMPRLAHAAYARRPPCGGLAAPPFFGMEGNDSQEFPMGIIAKARAAIGKVRNFDPETAYLEEATSVLDLEMRQREIDRGKFRKRNYPY